MKTKRAVLLTGDRDWLDQGRIDEVLGDLPPGTLLIHGNCRGVDQMGHDAAMDLLGMMTYSGRQLGEAERDERNRRDRGEVPA